MLLRHGAASPQNGGLADQERALAPLGHAEAARVAGVLNDEGPRPDLIVCSTATRASATAEIVATNLTPAVPVEAHERLYLASPETCLAVLKECNDRAESVLLVGHNPGLELLVNALTGETVTFATGGLVRIDVSISSWEELGETPCGTLVRR